MDPIWWAVILLVIGLALIFLEVFVPSGGLISCLAALAVLASIAVAFYGSVTGGMIMLIVTAIILPVVIVMAVKWWPHTPLGRLILLPRPENPDDVLPDTEEYRGLESLIGQIGVARCKMLPSGVVKIGRKTYEAVSDGLAVDEGQHVKVIDVRTHRLVVRPLRDDEDYGQETSANEPEEEADLLDQPIDSLGLDDPLA